MTPMREAVIQPSKPALPAHFAQTLRGLLGNQYRAGLIDQIVQLVLSAQQLQPIVYQPALDEQHRIRSARMARLRAMALDRTVLLTFLARYQAYGRERLMAEGYLLPSAPTKGAGLIADRQRTAAGNQLLQYAKDLLFGLLFGDESTQTDFARVERELLTFTLPRRKSQTLSFMQACTELTAAGTWQDPANVANDMRADNILFEIEYGEVKDELIGDGILRCLSLINHLEVNEQIFYARMINIEQSTLVA